MWRSKDDVGLTAIIAIATNSCVTLVEQAMGIFEIEKVPSVVTLDTRQQLVFNKTSDGISHVVNEMCCVSTTKPKVLFTKMVVNSNYMLLLSNQFGIECKPTMVKNSPTD